MNEDIIFITGHHQKNDKRYSHLEKMFIKIRREKASPVILFSVMVEYYRFPHPLSQVANVITPDARTLSVQTLGKKNMLHEN